MMELRRRRPAVPAAVLALALFASDFIGYSRGFSFIQTRGPLFTIGVALVRFVLLWACFAFYNVYERKTRTWTWTLALCLVALLVPVAAFLSSFINDLWPVHH